jgi:hypothetical protein
MHALMSLSKSWCSLYSRLCCSWPGSPAAPEQNVALGFCWIAVVVRNSSTWWGSWRLLHTLGCSWSYASGLMWAPGGIMGHLPFFTVTWLIVILRVFWVSLAINLAIVYGVAETCWCGCTTCQEHFQDKQRAIQGAVDNMNFIWVSLLIISSVLTVVFFFWMQNHMKSLTTYIVNMMKKDKLFAS